MSGNFLLKFSPLLVCSGKIYNVNWKGSIVPDNNQAGRSWVPQISANEYQMLQAVVGQIFAKHEVSRTIVAWVLSGQPLKALKESRTSMSACPAILLNRTPRGHMSQLGLYYRSLLRFSHSISRNHHPTILAVLLPIRRIYTESRNNRPVGPLARLGFIG